MYILCQDFSLHLTVCQWAEYDLVVFFFFSLRSFIYIFLEMYWFYHLKSPAYFVHFYKSFKTLPSFSHTVLKMLQLIAHKIRSWGSSHPKGGILFCVCHWWADEHGRRRAHVEGNTIMMHNSADCRSSLLMLFELFAL